MARMSNAEARQLVDMDYQGECIERNIDMLDMERVKNGWDYYDQYNKPCTIKDAHGNVVGIHRW